MPKELVLASHHRILGVFPHPDDEAMACGILLQRAVKVGAKVLAVFLTLGEGNTWPLRALERKWRITPKHRLKFALRRKGEALASLAKLGVPASAAKFLRWPDAKLTQMLLQNPQAPVAAMAQLMQDFQPTHIASPVLWDRHPDHSAAASLVFAALQSARAQVLGYAVHVPSLPPLSPEFGLAATGEELGRKREAIAAHQSQLIFRGRFFKSFARDEEHFYSLAAPDPNHHVRPPTGGKVLRVTYQLPLTVRLFFRPHLQLLFGGSSVAGASFPLPLLRKSGEARDSAGRQLRFSFKGSPWRGHLHCQLPEDPEWVLIKVHRPFLLFEESGFTLMRASQVE
ncbi:MAG: PIG-L deacetylase family protein [Thermoanaerobaculaceae bacterium]